jgi:hypothetical protein
MDAIESVLADHLNGFANSVETIAVINAIVTEWRI